MKVRRTIASLPLRSAAETWSRIVELISGESSVDRQQLRAASPKLCSVIADELLARVPLVVKGGGPRLVIYCAYGEEALSLGPEVDALDWNPTASDQWQITAPAETADVAWMREALASVAPRITVHDVDVPPKEEQEQAEANVGLQIDWDEAKTR